MRRLHFLLPVALLIMGATLGCLSAAPPGGAAAASSVEARIQKVQNDPRIPPQVKQGIIAGIKTEAKTQ